MNSTLAKLISTVCGLGYLPKAPGTFGSLPGLFLGLLTHHFFYQHQYFFLISTLIGIAICVKAQIGIYFTEKKWAHDDKRIVVDELAGQYFTTVYFPVTFSYALMGFILFRFFDILKPWPIRWVDKEWKHSCSTLADDLLAAVFAILCLYLWQRSGICFCCLRMSP